MQRTVIGGFKSHQQAEQAVSQMRDKGFTQEEISILAKDQQGRQGGQERGNAGGTTMRGGENIGDGITTGGVLGGLGGLLIGAGALAIPGVGPIIAAGPLAGALSGAVAGGIVGGLVDYGIPEERGRHYEQKLKEGDVLAVVRADEKKINQAANIMRQNGAHDVEIH